MTESAKCNSVKVLEAYTRDVGRGVCRVDYDMMDKLGSSTGEIIEIRGKRKTVAKILPLYPSDEGKGMMRVDGLIRKNLKSEIGSQVEIIKIKSEIAIKIIITALEAVPPINMRYIADALESVSVVKGDIIMIPYFGSRINFKVIKTTPSKVVTIHQKTIFELIDKKKESEVICPTCGRAVD